jgi:hypothetical protein
MHKRPSEGFSCHVIRWRTPRRRLLPMMIRPAKQLTMIKNPWSSSVPIGSTEHGWPHLFSWLTGSISLRVDFRSNPGAMFNFRQPPTCPSANYMCFFIWWFFRKLIFVSTARLHIFQQIIFPHSPRARFFLTHSIWICIWSSTKGHLYSAGKGRKRCCHASWTSRVRYVISNTARRFMYHRDSQMKAKCWTSLVFDTRCCAAPIPPTGVTGPVHSTSRAARVKSIPDRKVYWSTCKS